MRSLIVDIYRIVYSITKGRLMAIIFGVAYMTTLNMITLKGLGLLMEGFLPVMANIRKLFSFPYYIVTALVVIGLTMWVMPSLNTIVKESKKKGDSWGLLIYSVFAVLLFVYIKMD